MLLMVSMMIPMMRMLSKPAQVVTIMMMRMPAEVDDDENAILSFEHNEDFVADSIENRSTY